MLSAGFYLLPLAQRYSWKEQELEWLWSCDHLLSSSREKLSPPDQSERESLEQHPIYISLKRNSSFGGHLDLV